MCVFWVNGGENKREKKERGSQPHLDFTRDRLIRETVRCQMSSRGQTILFLNGIPLALSDTTRISYYDSYLSINIKISLSHKKRASVA